MNPLILTLSMLLLCVPAFAQSAGSDPTKELERLVLTSETDRTSVRSNYDKFEDRTRYWTTSLPVRGTDGGVDQSLTIMGFFYFRGKGAGHAIERLGLVFHSRSPELRFARHSHLYAIVDGQRLDLKVPFSNERDIQGTTITEMLAFTVPYKTLKRIAEGKAVEMKLGQIEFHLTQTNLSDLKALLGKVQAANP